MLGVLGHIYLIGGCPDYTILIFGVSVKCKTYRVFTLTPNI